METSKDVLQEMKMAYNADGYINYEKAEDLQERLHRAYLGEYQPIYSVVDHSELICRMWRQGKALNISKVNPHGRRLVTKQWVWECFTEATQHIYGVTQEHCLDQVIIAMERQSKERQQ